VIASIAMNSGAITVGITESARTTAQAASTMLVRGWGDSIGWAHLGR
jgi:hypothetical protein